MTALATTLPPERSGPQEMVASAETAVRDVLLPVRDDHGNLVRLAVAPHRSDGSRARPVAPVAPVDDNQALRDALALVRDVLRADGSIDDAHGDADRHAAALRERVDLLERLGGATAAGLASTLATMRRSGAIEADGAASTSAWLTAHTGRSRRDAARAARLADNLDEMPATAAALATGELTAESADAMVQAARDGRLGGPAQVERDLLDLATSGAPEQLRSGIRERQQAADGAAMLRDEQRQRSARAFHLARRDSGMWDVRGALPDEVGQQFAIALDAFDQPDPDSTPLLERRRPEQRRADALAALVGVAMDRGFAPGTGGIVRPHVSVIVPATTFTADLAAPPSRPDDGHGDGHDLGSDDQAVGIDDPAWTALAAGDLERGGKLSPQAVRRICCDADVTRIIMTPTSQVLDVGRTTRVWSQPQRRAVNARDRHCRGPSCDRPIGWTQIHHIRWWKRDRGPTNLDNGIALCTHCHHLVHDRGWTVQLDPATAGATWTSPLGEVTVNHPPAQHRDTWRPALAVSGRGLRRGNS